MVRPGVELIAGLTNDAHFGPCLMIGMGGVLTEVFQDVQFLLLPATRTDIHGALTRLKGYQLLTGFRGATGCGRRPRRRRLAGLGAVRARGGRLLRGRRHQPSPRERGGSDRSGRQGHAEAKGRPPRVGRALRRRRLTSPASSLPGRWRSSGPRPREGKPGHIVIENILANGYGGDIYLVNPKGGEILGLPVYAGARRSAGGHRSGGDHRPGQGHARQRCGPWPRRGSSTWSSPPEVSPRPTSPALRSNRS